MSSARSDRLSSRKESEITRFLGLVRRYRKRLLDDGDIKRVVIYSSSKTACAKIRTFLSSSIEDKEYAMFCDPVLLLDYIQRNRDSIHSLFTDLDFDARLRNVLQDCEFPVMKVTENMEVSDFVW